MRKISYIFLHSVSMFILLSFVIGQLSIQEQKFSKVKDSYTKDILKHKNKYDSLYIELKHEKTHNIRLQDSIQSMLTFNSDNVRRYLSYFNVAHEDIVYSQSLLETGFFSSEVFKANNNLFGMRNPYSRATTSKGSYLKHAVYSSYMESIKDYKIYQDYYYNSGSYYSFLTNSRYATDTMYIRKIKSIHNDVRREQSY